MKKDIIIDLYMNQYKIICYYLIKNGCTKEDAQDIVQNSFIKAINYIDGLDKDSISSWLFKVAMNEYKNIMKRNEIIRFISIDSETFYREVVSDCKVDEAYISKGKSEDIINILNELKERERTLLVLKYDMELSYKEISLLLGIPEDVVKTYLYRARNNFKNKWRELNE